MIEVHPSSIEEFENGLKNFDMIATQVSSGVFCCNERCLSLPMLDLSSRIVATSMQYHAVLEKNKFFIAFQKGKFKSKLNGMKIKEISLFIVRRMRK